jgi:hypothetical protein
MGVLTPEWAEIENRIVSYYMTNEKRREELIHKLNLARVGKTGVKSRALKSAAYFLAYGSSARIARLQYQADLKKSR